MRCFEHLGYDFRHYSDASRNRRLMVFVDRHSFRTISEAQGQVLRIRRCWRPFCRR